MTYDESMIAPLRDGLVALGFQDLRTPEHVDRFMADSKDGVALLVVNSVCSCARGTMRPALAQALAQPARPHTLGMVFAGPDGEATRRAREFFTGYPPSSPAVALFRHGELVFMVQRPEIKGQYPAILARDLAAAFRRALGEEDSG